MQYHTDIYVFNVLHYMFFTFRPFVNISDVPEEAIWTCLAFDCVTMLLFLIDFLSLAAATIVADHFWNANYDFTHTVHVLIYITYTCIIDWPMFILVAICFFCSLAERHNYMLNIKVNTSFTNNFSE